MKKFVWNFCQHCNYQCPYCFHSQEGWDNIVRRHGGEKPAGTVIAAWERIAARHGACSVYITGGEPFLYPDFAEMVAGMAKNHRVHVTSNLSQPVDRFAAAIDAGRVEINATFHPLYADIEIFAGHVACLRAAGFTCGVCYLMHPLQLREMLQYKDYLARRGIDMALTPFSGLYEGKQYPQAYSAQEQALCRYVDRWTEGDGRHYLLHECYAAADENVLINGQAGHAEAPAARGEEIIVDFDGTMRPAEGSPVNIYDAAGEYPAEYRNGGEHAT